MVPSTGCVFNALVGYRAYLCSLRQVRPQNIYSIVIVLTTKASSMSRKLRFERSPQFKSIILRLVVLLATLCFCACSSCIPRLTPEFVSSHLKLSGTRIISSFLSSLGYTPTLPDALSVTQATHSHPLLEPTSGIIALATKDGDGSSGEVDFTCVSVSTVRFEAEERPKL
jgi:hypothetical protein